MVVTGPLGGAAAGLHVLREGLSGFDKLVAALVLPPLAGLLGLLGLAVLLWCVVHFTRALHAFEGFGRTILALFIGAVIVVFALSMLLSIFGFGGPQNV